mgnify:CR=1 FL=1|tara:strand:- start:28 stop:405 length:378 start_codon:yes stop_codon:yes gene_type:complete
MKPTHEITRIQLLSEAKCLVAKAVKAGLMSYPHGTEVDTDGTPLIDPDDDLDDRITKHTPEVCRQAYVLRERGLTLEQVAKACHVATGSVAYIIAKGHEAVLKEQRLSQVKPLSQDSTNSTKESP